ncbi:hypothetical protein [Streptomyces sp. SID14515]|uniref:hypothetical protein n=1 Tax=Streptomyces sp. SID14515 TaxID=2706074 RepID=UPI0013CD65D3|nr:hypothetical protein [Streptomyces sp. SID14515]NEB35825.1 hypothetical protein [Streptomyces sp. SID14515]
MHSTLTGHARCLYGDENRPTPKCDLEHREHYFVEELTFADADAILGLWLHGPDWDHIAAELTRRADALGTG